jgi:antitoxin (DNA-binding transcriptional repressor) of toxin-antitoxin stability system
MRSEMVGMMSSKIVTVEEAATRLLELIGLAEQGEDIVISHEDQAKVKLVPIGQRPQKRLFGQNWGQIWMRPDFDDPLPDDFCSVGRHEAVA